MQSLLAQELVADELIMDDMRDRREAERRRLSVTGTIGVLRAGTELELLDFRDTVDRLLRMKFRIEKRFLDRLIRGEEV
jgi:predicted nucleic acid-binding protein